MKTKLLILLSSLLVFVTGLDLFAQQSVRIYGKVLDATTGEPVIGATVWVKNTTVGMTTDLDGLFSFKYEGKHPVVEVGCLGYASVEVLADGKELTVRLESDSQALDDVVVVAYGKQSQTSIVGSIATIQADKLEMPVAKLSTSLMGNLSGVVALNRNAEPGAGSTFWIRGVSTFGANADPLVLVDGVERSLDLVDVEDIKDFSILKDAAATAIYGVRGANGVILITTKSGEEGKPKITLKMESGILQPVKVPEMANSAQFAEMYNDALGYEYYGSDVINAYRTQSDPDLYPDVDWLKEIYKSHTWNQRANLSVSGGTSIVKYYVSGGFYNEDGLFAKDNMQQYNTSAYYRRFNFRANVDIKLHKYTTLNINLSTAFERKNQPGTSSSDIWNAAYTTSPNAFPMYYSNGQLAGDGHAMNPYALLTQTGYKQEFHTTAQSLFGLTQDFSEWITPGLTANIKFSFDSRQNVYQNRTRTPILWMASGRDENGDLITTTTASSNATEHLGYGESHSGDRSSYLEGSINYSRKFGNHNVGALFLYQHSQRNELSSSRGNNSASSEAAIEYRHQGIAGRVTYGYADRYFVEANFGYNGSENFAPGHRFGFFPSVALGYMISNEKFWKPISKTIDQLKIRASYGKVGNDEIGGGRRFLYMSTLGSSYSYAWGTEVKSTSGSSVGHWANTEVSWEESKKLDLGLDLSMFYCLKLNVDYFHEMRDGIFLQRNTIPYYTGISQSYMPYVNVGEMMNQGVDATLVFTKKIGEVDVMLRGNFTYARNKILDMDEPDNDWAYLNSTGLPRWQNFGYVALGLFKDQAEIDASPKQDLGSTPRPGDIKYMDLNNDGIINSFDRKPIGYTDVPEIVYGAGASLRWKGFDFSFLFQGATHCNFFINYGHTTAFSSTFIRRSSVLKDVYGNYWSESNPDPNAKYPRLAAPGQGANNTEKSTFWMVDGSYCRLKSAELGYTIPSRITKKAGIQTLRVYLSGVNLLTFSPFRLWDPELSNVYAYPNNRTVSLALNIGF